MDRIMVISERTKGASESNPVILTRGIDFEYIGEGEKLIKPYDSIVMLKDVTVLKPLFSFGNSESKNNANTEQEEYVKIKAEVLSGNER